MEIKLEDGKYTYIRDDKGSRALRHGEPWRDLAGDNLVGAMAYRIEELEEQNKRLFAELAEARS